MPSPLAVRADPVTVPFGKPVAIPAVALGAVRHETRCHACEMKYGFHLSSSFNAQRSGSCAGVAGRVELAVSRLVVFYQEAHTPISLYILGNDRTCRSVVAP